MTLKEKILSLSTAPPCSTFAEHICSMVAGTVEVCVVGMYKVTYLAPKVGIVKYKPPQRGIVSYKPHVSMTIRYNPPEELRIDMKDDNTQIDY